MFASHLIYDLFSLKGSKINSSTCNNKPACVHIIIYGCEINFVVWMEVVGINGRSCHLLFLWVSLLSRNYVESSQECYMNFVGQKDCYMVRS